MTAIMDKYVSQNPEQQISETDLFTLERYAQFNRFLPVGAKSILDAGEHGSRRSAAS
jgi:hypothetical protein